MVPLEADKVRPMEYAGRERRNPHTMPYRASSPPADSMGFFASVGCPTEANSDSGGDLGDYAPKPSASRPVCEGPTRTGRMEWLAPTVINRRREIESHRQAFAGPFRAGIVGRVPPSIVGSLCLDSFTKQEVGSSARITLHARMTATFLRGRIVIARLDFRRINSPISARS
jgi:hypothetical protein